MRRILFSIAALATASLVMMGCEQNKYAYPPYKNGDQVSAQEYNGQQSATQSDQQRPSVFSVDDGQNKSDSAASESGNANNQDSLPVVQPDSQDSQTSDNANTYTIRRGDTLWSIAKNQLGNGHKWKEIVDANPGLNPHKLAVGQKIVLPSE